MRKKNCWVKIVGINWHGQFLLLWHWKEQEVFVFLMLFTYNIKICWLILKYRLLDRLKAQFGFTVKVSRFNCAIFYYFDEQFNKNCLMLPYYQEVCQFNNKRLTQTIFYNFRWAESIFFIIIIRSDGNNNFNIYLFIFTKSSVIRICTIIY